MSVPVVVNNENFTIPENFDTGYGDQVTNWIVVISASTLQLSGGDFFITADINFGPNFGLLAKYFETIAANPAQSGEIRLAFTDTIDWRNSDNSADLPLGVDVNDLLVFNGNEVIDDFSDQTVQNKSYQTNPTSITSSTYTIQLADSFSNFLLFNSSSAQTVYIPDDNTTLIPVGTEIPMSRSGTGSVTVSALNSNITIQSPYQTSNLRVQYSSASVVKIAPNIWRLVGDFDNS